MLKKLAFTGIFLLIALSLTYQSFAQGAATGESQRALATGQLLTAPGTAAPGVWHDRLSYWELAGLGKKVTAMPPGNQLYNPYSIFGPYGIHGQYSIYGPYGMYGPNGPGYGSGLGFNGFGMNDPWVLFKEYRERKAQVAASQEKAPAPKAAASATKSASATGQTKNAAAAKKTAPAEADKTATGPAD